MNKTKIEWCDDTSNFVTGCTHGCEYCYARRMATRFAGKEGTVYHRLKSAGYDPFTPAIHLDVLGKLRHRLKGIASRRVFIASMGDIGCDGEYLLTQVCGGVWPDPRISTPMELVFALCEESPQHTFLLLSKNPASFKAFEWPRNAHVGTSIDSTNAVTSQRLWTLEGVRAPVKWVSIEPLLDPLFSTTWLEFSLGKLSWIVVGGLSGKKPLPEGCLAAVDRIVSWCKLNSIPVFVKDNIDGGPWPKEYPRVNRD